jgi:hypothetical protein
MLVQRLVISSTALKVLSMSDSELVGLWSHGALYGPGAQSDDWLIFKPDGTGRYEFLNWMLCSAELFHWETPRPGVLRFIGDRHLQIAADLRSVEEEPSLLGTREVAYTITEEDTPARGRIRVLRLPLEMPMLDRFGFARADLTGLDEPEFKLEQ